MKPSWLSVLSSSSLAILSVGAILPLSAGEVMPPTAYAAPDMSAYDCAGAAKAAAHRTLHIGQVIDGIYYEWNQTYISPTASEAAPTLLGCISLLKPDALSLDSVAAANFLRRSAAIGVPATSSAPSAGNAKQRSAATFSPRDVPPEPPKRVLRRDHNASRSRAAAPLSPAAVPTTPIMPPTPAEHRHSDDDTAALPPGAIVQKPQAKALDARAAAASDPRMVIPGSTTTTYPYNTIGYLVVTYPNGQTYRCTGFLVSPYVVLTAGHCIHNNNRGGWASFVEFYPGLYQDTVGGAVHQPYPANTNFANLKATQQWTQISGPDSFDITQYRYDFAAIQFKTPFTYTSTFMPVVFKDEAQNTYTAGYPANLSSVTRTVNGMYSATGSETSDSRNFLRQADVREFAVASSGGDSGSPFMDFDIPSGPRMLMGSLSYSDDTNTAAGGPWYDDWNRDLLMSWLTWTPGNASSPSPMTSAPTIALTAAASLGQPSLSFLRFYNEDTTAGTATVILASGVTGQHLYTWTSPPIAGGAVLQYGLADIEYMIPASLRTQTYTLSVQPSFNGYFQHVLWNPGMGVLTNLSTCSTNATNDPKILISVHSRRVGAGYPSYIVAHNTGASATNVNLGVYDGRNGSRLGGYVLQNIPADGEMTIGMTTIENTASIAPPTDLPHYVVKVEGGFTGYLQHLVNNASINVVTDLSGVCALSSS